MWICALIVLFSYDSYSFCCVEFVVACMFVVCYCSAVVGMIPVVALVCVYLAFWFV